VPVVPRKQLYYIKRRLLKMVNGGEASENKI
jgi:hypothetical protein